MKTEIERTYNSATPDRLLATRHKISALDYVYDSAGLNKNIDAIREAQEQLTSWSNLELGRTYIDYRERDDILKSSLLTSVEQWKAMEFTMHACKAQFTLT